MMENPNVEYRMKTEQYDVGYEDYMNFEKSFGAFSKDGREYTVTDRRTPRQWLNFMVNDRFASVAGNDGSGFFTLDAFYVRITKFYCASDYLIRTLNGRRRILLKDCRTGREYDLLKDCGNMTYTVRPGEVVYRGSMEKIAFEIGIFVPNEDPCECWRIHLKRNSGAGKYLLTAGEDIAFLNLYHAPKTAGDTETEIFDGQLLAASKTCMDGKTTYTVFAMEGAAASAKRYAEQAADGEVFEYTRAELIKEVILGEKESVFYVTAGADYDADKCREMAWKYADPGRVRAGLDLVTAKWDRIIERNCCEIPDKGLQDFLNIWLKNQIYLTMRYNRFDIMGYRDVMQDFWGHLLVDPGEGKGMLLEAISKMYADGRCPRQYDRFSQRLDDRDFMDSPLWIPAAICDYVKETGDYSVLEEKTGYLHSDRQDTVREHILLALDYLYGSRGKNGLILMRRGDWLDGLNGIDAYGEATTVWGTMAAFWAQNQMAELLEKTGDQKTAQMLKQRSSEYQEIVNRVGWDGNWFTYAFIEEEPIGSCRCREGKIYLNPQSWAMLTGICRDEKRLAKMNRSIGTYLMSMYGPHLMAPPYTKYGDKCGRIQNQRPGTFANSAIYLHAASFLAAAYCACGRYDDALDLMQRILPVHPDNCDTRRTSEPYCVGNVYYGITHPCHGFNLFSWFTATPSWMIHCGFEGLLGVKADYDGLRIEPHEMDGWESYAVTKRFRGTEYHIRFRRGDRKGIYVDGAKQEGNIIISDKKRCEVTVNF